MSIPFNQIVNYNQIKLWSNSKYGLTGPDGVCQPAYNINNYLYLESNFDFQKSLKQKMLSFDH